MIKDIVLALEVGSSRDAARDYAISVSAAFNAHLAAIGFDYAPVLPPVDTVSAMPFDILDAEREANRKAASDAIARFEEAARLAAVSAESRLVEASVSDATNVFGSIARSFDLSVVGQAEPKSIRDDLMIEGALFDSGRPVLVVPYIQRPASSSTASWSAGTAAAMRRARSTTPCRFSHAPRPSMWSQSARGRTRAAKSKAPISRNTSRGTD